MKNGRSLIARLLHTIIGCGERKMPSFWLTIIIEKERQLSKNSSFTLQQKRQRWLKKTRIQI